MIATADFLALWSKSSSIISQLTCKKVMVAIDRRKSEFVQLQIEKLTDNIAVIKNSLLFHHGNGDVY